jgi:predicted transcriptional regulator
MNMDDRDTIGGKPVSDEQIAEWADEAEAGYDVDDLKKRGRPRLGSAIAQVATLRLDPELDAALNERAERDHTTRSSVMRDALRAWLEAS